MDFRSWKTRGKGKAGVWEEAAAPVGRGQASERSEGLGCRAGQGHHWDQQELQCPAQFTQCAPLPALHHLCAHPASANRPMAMLGWASTAMEEEMEPSPWAASASNGSLTEAPGLPAPLQGSVEPQPLLGLTPLTPWHVPSQLTGGAGSSTWESASAGIC